MENKKKDKSCINKDYEKMENEYKIEIATQTLERNINFISSCDNKTSIVLTAIGVLLTIILTNDGLNTIYDIVYRCLQDKTFCNVLYLIFFAGTILIMILGMYNLGSVLIARTRINADNTKGTEFINSRIFFSGIRENGDLRNYKEKFCSMNRQELLDELLTEIYINADIAVIKYKKYNIGYKFTITGFILFVSIILIGIYIY